MEDAKADAASARSGAQGTPAAAEAAAPGAAQATDELFASDEFRMYAFKILPGRVREEFAGGGGGVFFGHVGPLFRAAALGADKRMERHGTGLHLQNQPCPRGDSCQYCHSVFEYWMHPSRYRTQLCQNGANCRRTVCFFAHSVSDLRTDPSHLNLGGKGGSSSGAGAQKQQGQGQKQEPKQEQQQQQQDKEQSGGSETPGRSSSGMSERGPSDGGGSLTTTTTGSLPAPLASPSGAAAAAAAAAVQAHAQAYARAQASSLAARARRESAPTRLMEACSPVSSPMGGPLGGRSGGAQQQHQQAAAAYDLYLSGRGLTAAARSLSLPATPHLARAGSGGMAPYACRATPASWAPADDAGDAWWPPQAAGVLAGLPGAPAPAPRGGPGGFGAAGDAYVQLLEDRAAAAAASFLENRALIEQHAAAAAMDPFARWEPQHYGDYPQGPDPAAAAAQQQFAMMQQAQQRLAAARSVSSDAASIAAALALAGSSSLDSSYSAGFPPYGGAPPQPGTPSAPRSPALGRDGGGGGCAGSPLASMRSFGGGDLYRSGDLHGSGDFFRGGELMRSASLASQREQPALPPQQLQRMPSCAGGGLDVPLAASAPELSPPAPQHPACGSPPLAAGPPPAGLGMLSPMAAPSRDSVVVPSAHLAGLPGQPSLQQHLAQAGLATGGAGGEDEGGGGGRRSEDDALRGLVDALMTRLQKQC
ncbi:hypothetical protein Rsub_00893 [Raphidocelis subcapitata]|uniref:C3H1-type domain-containing protein n=1 Tax=Raphidocelis subcapitata TaxID=307507 RepID=A0A2V0NLB2_9CHLO|nr:hypothetical protein Rsub_00893 [Raphidocelis subcapitata]|eukprot:GBF88181.1 hypothetical protein Rsub_00893 [Raphidocelis subcapitata]